ncbi:GUN4 domain-containing protein [Nostoc sp. CCY 9925]|uniref:GUN4 domain-containing protein n=1 Tax=Nostoc sp. CCY 9925 TaxID=3103865 RepID=UPI0039C66FCD
MAEVSLKVFCSYSHKDESLRDELANHLSAFTHQGVISIWHDRNISAGEEWNDEIKTNLKTADIILLLISSDFIASKYCWTVEVQTAIERHEAGDACVIPVILRSIYWKSTPFAKLQSLPKNAEPVTSWADRDAAFTNVAEGFWNAAEKLIEARKQKFRQQEEIGSLQNLKEREEAERVRQEHQFTSNNLSSEKDVDYTRLHDLLKAEKWKQADEETLAVMLKASGREREGSLDFKSFENFPCADLRTIDQLWVKYSNGHFGFSVQKRIWERERKDYEKFGEYVGWLKYEIVGEKENVNKLLELLGFKEETVTRTQQRWLNYSEFRFNTSSPKGHLPYKGWGIGDYSGLGVVCFSIFAPKLIECNL